MAETLRTPAGGDTQRVVYAVSELNEILRALIEDSLPSLWVQGEVSNFAKPASGHWYFTLKDQQAQIRCVMFRQANYYIRPVPQSGDAVLLRAKPGVYPGRGELQLIVQHLEPAGTGALLRAFEELKRKLAAEGLFDASAKRPLPQAPRRIGLITSGSGAAMHDVLTTLARRWPLVAVQLYSVPVQGATAAGAIIEALQELPRRVRVDVILLVRGGGSIEDLWSFNDEALARAIRNCPVPVVTGIGHEVDITIADLAADLRAATPTAAAELATPDIAERAERIEAGLRALADALGNRLELAAERIDRYEARLQTFHPGRRLNERAQRLDELELRLQRCTQSQMGMRSAKLAALVSAIARASPRLSILSRWQMLDRLVAGMNAAWRAQHTRVATRLVQAEGLLGSLNPLSVLQRGYAIVQHAAGGVLRDAANAQPGETLRVRVARGAMTAQVQQVLPDDQGL